MGAGNSSALQGGRTVLAGTYVAEQMSPAQFTLMSASAPKGEKNNSLSSRTTKKQKYSDQGMDGAGCTILPALASIDPLLTKEQPAKSTAAASPKALGPGKKPPTAPERTEAHKRLYPGRKLRVGVAGGGMMDEWVDKTNEDLITWLSRPNTSPKAGNQTNTSSQSELASASSSTARLPQASPSTASLRSTGTKRSQRSHDNHYDLFQTALRGVGGPSDGSKRGLKLYSPGSTRQRKQPPLTEQIKPIHITPECSVAALKAADKQAAMERLSQDWAKAAVGGNSKPTLFRTKVSKVLDKVREESGPVDPSIKARAALNAMRPDEKDQEENGEKVLECVLPSQKIPGARKEACEALRFFVFGISEAETKEREKEVEKQKEEKVEKPKEKDAKDSGKKEAKEAPKFMLPERVFYQPRGTKEESIKLLKIWYKLDDDQSGRVDVTEFRQFTSSINNNKLADKVCAALLGKKSSFTIEDMMRIVWPCATGKDIKQMKTWMDEYKDSIKVVKAPPLLPQEELEALVENFKFFDSDGSGQVSFAELVESGLLDKEQADRIMIDYDEDGSGELDKDEFCEVFCVNGYRAFEEAKRATDPEGNLIVLDEALGWHIKIDPKKEPSVSRSSVGDDGSGL